MASRDLSALAPIVRARALAFIAECQRQQLQALIYCTGRTPAEQDALYASGRTKPGPILTNARGLQSGHVYGPDGFAWAFDAVPMFNGKCLWTDDAALNTMGACGEAVGLEWAGRWRGKLRELVHFQLTRGST